MTNHYVLNNVANKQYLNILILPNDDLPFRLEANGSGIATGAVLSQQSVDGNGHKTQGRGVQYSLRGSVQS
jgi:hypothetical protein